MVKRKPAIACIDERILANRRLTKIVDTHAVVEYL